MWAIRFHLDREGRLRDKTPFDLAIDSKLRGCNLVKINIGDVVAGAEIRNRATAIQQKTKKPVQFGIAADVPATLLAWWERRGGSTVDCLFPSRVDPTGHMSTRQYASLVDERVTAIELRKAEYATHSLRRTKAAMIQRVTDRRRSLPASPAAIDICRLRPCSPLFLHKCGMSRCDGKPKTALRNDECCPNARAFARKCTPTFYAPYRKCVCRLETGQRSGGHDLPT
ncbi:hypothetical protein HME9302_02587 [Alteripontixanthobacter maritimus]|uniref:Tyr recombinase domain-containing protein n=1 Tax=Alteripontixanthobacter maritimus TaxID=2161824 RepID=A0A369QCR9_9SPHN|nr:hypothetical protein [Alteripontixanthobacter maritimus]RDC61365.1 hypothetical protein HME9302_02587 [Alteripontixanthobacter maritimus]